jgi:hydroxymethylpyrimidine pyrophosphatase-like HAD family hydrolase|tara:strand:- start:665 stop:1123 length:459 start_codon:yes stop_codon:yes gene_type:complete
MPNQAKVVIFDLDGTLALIDKRRDLATTSGRLNWDVFFDPSNIKLDVPNKPIIKIAQLFAEDGFLIVIFSGRSIKTEHTTRSWLTHNKVPFHKLVMRDDKRHFMPDNELKKQFLDEHVNIEDVFLVVDDRQQVVDMWRKEGLTCLQVAEGNF